jgi:DnaJ like chaperone protein
MAEGHRFQEHLRARRLSAQVRRWVHDRMGVDASVIAHPDRFAECRPIASYGERVLLLEAALGVLVALSPKKRRPEHVDRMVRVGTALGMSRERVDRAAVSLLSHDLASLGAAAVLCVDPDADVAAIKAAHRTLARKYHPDRVAHLADEFQELARRHMTRINEARRVLMVEDVELGEPSLDDCTDEELSQDDITLDAPTGHDDVALQFASADDDIEL